jgi:hypothetical protein
MKRRESQVSGIGIWQNSVMTNGAVHYSNGDVYEGMYSIYVCKCMCMHVCMYFMNEWGMNEYRRHKYVCMYGRMYVL